MKGIKISSVMKGGYRSERVSEEIECRRPLKVEQRVSARRAGAKVEHEKIGMILQYSPGEHFKIRARIFEN